MILALGVVACVSTAATPIPLPRAPDAAEVPLALHDVRGTASEVARLRQDFAELPRSDRDAAAALLAELAVTCPLTRATLQLPIALRLAVDAIEPDHLDPLVQVDLVHLKHGLDEHVALLDAIGVDLSPPAPGDFLYRSGPLSVELGPDAMIDRATLEAAADPIAATGPLLWAIQDLTRNIDMRTVDRIQDRTERLHHLTGQPWPLGTEVRGWQRAFQRIEPFVVERATQKRVRAIVELLDTFAGAGC